jgi:hypothetical protein
MTAERTRGIIAGESAVRKAWIATVDPDSTTVVYYDVITPSSM